MGFELCATAEQLRVQTQRHTSLPSLFELCIPICSLEIDVSFYVYKGCKVPFGPLCPLLYNETFMCSFCHQEITPWAHGRQAHGRQLDNSGNSVAKYFILLF